MRSPVALDGVSANGRTRTAAFQFRIDGTILDTVAVKHHAVYYFEVGGSAEERRIVRFREYNGENYEPEHKLAERGFGGVFGDPPTVIEKLEPSPQSIDAPLQLGEWSSGLRAFDAYAQGINGSPDPFLDLLSTDIRFTSGYPGRWRGVHCGYEAARDYLHWHRNVLFDGDINVEGVTASGTSVGFEHRLRGKMSGRLVDEPRSFFIDLKGNKVGAFRDYYGVSHETSDSFRGTPQEKIFSKTAALFELERDS